MKKNVWMFAAALTCGLALTSCEKSDNVVVNPDPIEEPDPIVRTTTLIDFEDEETVADILNMFPQRSRIGVSVVADEITGSNVVQFKGASNAQNGYSFSEYNFADKVEKAAQVVFNFDMYNTAGARGILTIGDAAVRGTSGGSSKVTYNKTGAIIRIGSDKNNFFVNDEILPMNDGTTEEGEAIVGLSSKWLNVTVKVNVFDRTVEYSLKDGDTELAASEEPIPFYADDANDCTQLDIFGYINNGEFVKLDNISVEAGVDTRIKFADYAVRYVDAEGNDLKEAVTRNGRVGQSVTLLDADRNAFKNAEGTKKYIFKEDNTETTPIAEENTEIKVVFRDAEVYTYRLNLRYEDGNNTLIPNARVDKQQFEGDALQVFHKLAFLNEADGKYYIADKVGSWEGRYYNFSGNEEANSRGVVQGDVYFKKDESVAYISEIEDLELLEGEVISWVGWTEIANGAGSFFDRFSNGRGPRLAEGAAFITGEIPAGTYTIFFYGRNGGGSDAGDQAPALFFKVGDELIPVEATVPTLGPAVTGSITIENVTVPAGAKLVIKNDGHANDLDLDYVKVFTPAPAAE